MCHGKRNFPISLRNLSRRRYSHARPARNAAPFRSLSPGGDAALAIDLAAEIIGPIYFAENVLSTPFVTNAANGIVTWKTDEHSWIVIEEYSPCPRSSGFLCGSRSSSAAVVLQAIVSAHSCPYGVLISISSIPALSRNAFSPTDHSDIAAMHARDAGSPSTANFIGHTLLKAYLATFASPLPKAM